MSDKERCKLEISLVFQKYHLSLFDMADVLTEMIFVVNSLILSARQTR